MESGVKNELLSIIANNWKLEAKLEESKYFYHYNEVSTILDNKRCFIIGRKGTGKTAICNHIVNKKGYDCFSERLSFKNYPFNELYSLNNVKYTTPNQYITLWKYLIYSSVCKLMSENENIDSEVRSELLKIYPKNNIKQLARRVSEWTSAEFGLNVLGNGGNLKADRMLVDPQATLSWIDKVNILEDVIANHCDDSKYYIVFDELDEDYREVSDNIADVKLYKSLLTSLFKAVQDVKATFSTTKLRIMPIVFLRDDIYALLNDADKNKWSDLKLELDWTEDKIKRMIAYRISQDVNDGIEQLPFEKAWDKIFHRGTVSYGKNKTKKMSSFDFIARSTHLRPRDFIKYIQTCCECSVERNEKYISASTIKYVDRAFSNYLKGEIRDEVFPLLPEIESIFQIISNIRKQIFTGQEFSKEYKKYIDLGTIQQRNSTYVLDVLFNFSVIGNEEKFHKERHFFKYLHTNMTYNTDENIVLHRGLLKSLQII